MEDTGRGRPGEAVTMEERERKVWGSCHDGRQRVEGLGGCHDGKQRKAWGGCHDERQREEGMGRVEEVEGGKSCLQQSSETNYPVNCLTLTVPTPHPGQ